MNNNEEKAVQTETVQEKGLAVELYFWANTMTTILCLMVLFSVFVMRISTVDGISMLPTLRHSNQVLVKIAGYNEPEHGDIVVIICPGREDEPFVKRIIGMGGDVIDMDKDTGTVYLNGAPQQEDYINDVMRHYGSLAYPYEVPDGHVFVMGDNRNDSLDSRSGDIAAIPEENIIGKVVVRIWPINQVRTY